MIKYKFKSIRTRLAIWFLILTLIPLISALIVTYFQQVNSIKSEAFDKLTAIRDLKTDNLYSWLEERKADMITISTNKELTNLEYIINKKSSDQDNINILNNIRRVITHYFNNSKAYTEIFILNPSTGKILVSTETYMEGEDRSDENFFTEPLQSGELFIRDIYYSNKLAAYAMMYAIPIFDTQQNSKNIVGILVVRIDLKSTLYKMLLKRVGLGETGETIIVNKAGLALNELRWYDNAPLNLKISAEPVIKAIKGNTGIAFTKDYRGKKILAAYTYIPEPGWGFVCKQDITELYAPIHELLKYFMILFSITLALILGLILLISNAITKPIIDITKVAKKINEGDYSARNAIRSRDELGFLAGSANEMAASIESRLAIEKSVRAISETMIKTLSIRDFGTELLKQLMEITKANMSTFYILNEGTSKYEHFTSIGANEELLKSFNAENPEGEFGKVLSKKEISYLKDIPEDTIFKFQTTAGDAIPKEIITIPVLVDSTVVALISLVNINKFSNEIYKIIKQVWMGINTSYSNLIANERTRILAENLQEINQKLEAQSEELQEQNEELISQEEELKQQGEELEEQNIELENQQTMVEEANRLKSEFLSNMSHELRTPLNSILALSGALLMQAGKKLTDEENNYLKIVERNGKQLLKLINDILNISKIEAGKIEINRQEFSLSDTIRKIIESIEPLAEKKNLEIRTNIAKDIPKLHSDEAKLFQILQNIAANAVKFTEEGYIEISAEKFAESVQISVKDTGIGMTEQDQEHVFDEFRQIDGSTSRQFEGTGLGLSISAKLVKILGGKIQVGSTPGVGTIFTITIPLKIDSNQILSEARDFKKQTVLSGDDSEIDKQQTSPAITQSSGKKRLLVVEDNEVAIIQIKTVLESEGYIVDVAAGGKQALEYMKANSPDGIILDLMMPEVDGFEVLESIRSTKSSKNLPVLILTAKDLTKADLDKLSVNNIQQLIQKGDIDKDGLLKKIHLMIYEKDEKKPDKPTEKITMKQTEPQEEKINSSVLIMENNKDNMLTFKAILSDDYDTLEAYDGKNGLKLALKKLPDLILLDIGLPKMDGFEVVKILKKSELTKNIPVIAVTAKAMKGDKEAILGAGCDDYLSKPVNPEELLSKVKKWITR